MKGKSWSANSTTLLECKNLVPAFTHFDSVSLSLASGEMLCISGPSGVGKSSLLFAFAGLRDPIHGWIRFTGSDITSFNGARINRIRRHEAVYLVPQSLPLISQLDLLDNVLFAQRIHGSGMSRDACLDILLKIGLKNRLHFLPSQLSIGEKQRVCVARGLATKASVLLIDEPTSNLDAESVSLLLTVFREATYEGRALLVVSNDSRLKAFADRVLSLEHAQECARVSS
jgi:putative ABC transport system ATP-binding protein